MNKQTPIQYQSARITVSVVREDNLGTNELDNPEKLHDFWTQIIAEQPDYEDDKESVVVVLLNTRFAPYAWNRVSLGTVNESSCHPREVLRPVIVAGAHAFALMHNHPSGDPCPSRADELVTRRIKEAADLMQVYFLDHVVVGRPSPGRQAYYSFREAGLV